MKPADTVTILRVKGQSLLTKRWTRLGDKTEERTYDKAWRFSAIEYPVNNIRELGELIRKISADPQSAVVRGGIAEGTNRYDMLRRARPRRDAPATLVAKPRWWLGLDLDEKNLCPPSIHPLFEPDATVEYAISQLPPQFHHTTCFWQFTAGHGMKPGIRLRLWYWLNRLVSDNELRRWLGERVRQDGVPPNRWPRRWPIDPVLFNPIQLHYTAAPIFDGLPDPVPVRCGWHCGFEDVVVIPDLAAAQERIWHSSTSTGPVEPGLGYEGWRARIGDHEGGAGFYQPINSAIGAYFSANGAHADADWLIRDLGAVLRERQGDRPDAYIDARLRDLPNAVVAIQDLQASSEAEETARARQIIRFEGDAVGPLLLAETCEDAEAGSHATGFEAKACLAGFAKTLIDGEPIDRVVVVLLADLDRFSPARRAPRQTIRQWQRQGRNVLLATPREISTGDGSTFADLLKKDGLVAVKARIEAALTPRTLPKRMPVEDARQLLGDVLKTAIEELASWTPPPA
jgi:hypothetical protein